MFHIRPATIADADSVSALLLESYATLLRGTYPAEILATALPLMTTAQPALLQCSTWYVVEDDDGSLIGCGGWTRERPGSGDVEPGLAHLRHFATSPRAARRGVGRALVDRCFEDGSAAGIDRWECYSTLMAEPFYASLGFIAIERFDVPMSDTVRFASVRMKRDAG